MKNRYSFGGDEHLFVECDENMSLEAFFKSLSMTNAVRDSGIAGVTEICPANPSFQIKFDPDVINGERQTSTRDPMTPLLAVLRDEFLLTGAKAVCREGICGACTVHLDGQPVVSCQVPIETIEGRDVCTVESLAPAGEPSPLQQIMGTR